MKYKNEQYFYSKGLTIERNHHHNQGGPLFCPITYPIDLSYSMGWQVDQLLWPAKFFKHVGKKNNMHKKCVPNIKVSSISSENAWTLTEVCLCFYSINSLETLSMRTMKNSMKIASNHDQGDEIHHLLAGKIFPDLLKRETHDYQESCR